MTPHSTDITRTLKWMHNRAPAITSLIKQKATWYDLNHHQFWSDWMRDVFDLRTANDFGMMTWCIILGVPSENFEFTPPTHQFAYGKDRENFVWSGARDGSGKPTDPLGNDIGGNFSAGASGSVYDPEEIRKLLQIRYAALICNGSMDFVNYMLRWVFNKGKPWDFDAGRYFYLTDSLVAPSSSISIDKVTMRDWAGDVRLLTTTHTNYARGSNAIDGAQWAKYGVTVSAAGSPYPDGSGNAGKLTSGAVSGIHGIAQTANVGGSGNVTLTFVAKRGTLGILRAVIAHGASYSLSSTVEIDIDARSWKVISGDATAKVDALADGFVRVSVTVNSTTSAVRYSVNMVKGAAAEFLGDTTMTIELGRIQIERSSIIGRYIPTADVAVGETDYTLTNAATGTVTTTFTPATGVKLYWDGTWGSADVNEPMLFGTGDGANKVFTVTKPKNAVLPVSTTYGLEYRIGPAMGISGQFLVLMQNDDVRILPTFAGVKAKVIQE